MIKGDSTDVDKFWRDIFKKMEHPIFGESYVSVFTDSLRERYPHIAKRIGGHHHLKCSCTSAVMSYPSGSGGNVSELSTTTTIIPESQEQLNSYQSNGSVGDSSDISTSTVIPEPKPETREWVQRHHSLTEIVETENLTNYTSITDRLVKNDSYMKFSDNSCFDFCKFLRFQRNRVKQILENIDNSSLINSSPKSQRKRLQEVHEDLPEPLIKGRRKLKIFKRPHTSSRHRPFQLQARLFAGDL